jgi:hypothetical protein
MRCKLFASAALLVAPFMLFGTPANAEEFTAKMVGFHEAPTSIFSANGQGTLHLDLDKKARTITFKETFSGLSSPVTQSHIHLGEIHTAGGVTVFFCTNLNNAPVQPCPAGGGTITGTITAGNVIGLPAQGLPAGDFDALVELLESRSGYVNVHTTNFPAGEIRGQIHRGDEEFFEER